MRVHHAHNCVCRSFALLAARAALDGTAAAKFTVMVLNDCSTALLQSTHNHGLVT
jgi:hypothetical protein